jgi:hypothetical protein
MNSPPTTPAHPVRRKRDATGVVVPHQPRWYPAFRDEIQRRVKEIDSGKVEGVDAFEALRTM